MSIKALIWDMEGVLLQTKEQNVEVAFANRLNVSLEAVSGIFHGDINDRVDIGELTEHDFWMNALNKLGMSEDRLPHVRNFLLEDFFIDPVLLEAIRDYRKTFKTAMLSNYSGIMRRMLESNWRVDGAFDEIIISCEVKMIKPHPEIFDYTLNKLQVAKDEAVLIDDRIVNIDGARQYGLYTVHFQDREQALKDLDDLIARNA